MKIILSFEEGSVSVLNSVISIKLPMDGQIEFEYLSFPNIEIKKATYLLKGIIKMDVEMGVWNNIRN